MRRRPPLVAAALATGLLAAAYVTAGAAWAAATAVVVVADELLELVWAGRPGMLTRARRRVEAGETTTTALRALAVVLLAVRLGGPPERVAVVALAGASVVVAVVRRGLVAVVQRERRPPVLTRNVPLDIEVPRTVGWRRAPGALAAVAWPAVAVGLAVDATGTAAHVGMAVAGAALLASVTPLLLAVAQLRGRRVRARAAEAAVAAFARLEPQVLLYFASTPEEIYQLDMWLAPVEALDVPAAVVVRDHKVLAAVGVTSLPVFSVRYNGAVARLPLPTGGAVGLFVTHSGNNLAMLRRDDVASVFVGHGDSDKPDSMNAFARVYDEVWVAGPVGRERYAAAAIGVHAEAIVEVGRPQLPGSADASADGHVPPEPLCVLYAPTWEGWGDDEHHTSLPHVGPQLVAALLARNVRVVYRPHPLTGVRDRSVRQAHEQVLGLLRDAAAADTAAAHRDRAVTGGGDVFDVALATARTRTPSRVEHDAAEATWSDRFFDAHHDRSVIVTEDPPTLHQTFRAAHVLVSDVSSVASDWLATGRPYAMVDTRGLGTAQLRSRFPVAAAAFVLHADLRDLDDLLATAREGGDAGALELTRAAVLGPADPQQAFRSAVLALLARPRPGAPAAGAVTPPEGAGRRRRAAR